MPSLRVLGRTSALGALVFALGSPAAYARELPEGDEAEPAVRGSKAAPGKKKPKPRGTPPHAHGQPKKDGPKPRGTPPGRGADSTPAASRPQPRGTPPGTRHSAQDPVEVEPANGDRVHTASGRGRGPHYAPRPVTHRRSHWMESYGQVPRFDFGGSIGFNSPGGALGIETGLRLTDWTEVGIHGGVGLWGYRVSPVAKLYPFGASTFGLFGEAGISFNSGGPMSVTENSIAQEIVQGPAAALNFSVGLRRQWLTYFWTSVKVGYNFNVFGGDFSVVDGSAATQTTQTTLAFARPGGLVVGLTAGIALF